MFKKYGFSLKSDFEIRVLREDETDIDIIIPLGDRTLNFYFDGMPQYIGSRIQFSQIKNIIIRFSKLEEVNKCTFHLLRNIDLYSSVASFEFEYTDYATIVRSTEYSAELRIERNYN